ncbi:uncharacterized protein PHACADRAFT_212434 [Phanerochaete carnosa HHB-10118-sp]|uniref:Uncharacterized protein n=1 Tax=Phanerochaete carnosa (strain HHB-10118-sp) TaxID=650164 RepID=K5VKD0_PHACS|nr:uncharacterized protein PHACADRAFT_212434 [Phanerochaete carnosa HHB-10118-sp]EKM51818.1 hypothetical protein PHACADRAFT_212434 [Phanerochaete carnosa HHB-10118-sp]
MLDYLDRIVGIPVPFNVSSAPDVPVDDPSQLFWHQETPSIVTTLSATSEGLRMAPTFKSLTYGTDPSEFKPFSPPTCSVPFGSPFTAASNLDDWDPPPQDVAGDSGYESDVPGQSSSNILADYHPTFHFPAPAAPPSSALPGMHLPEMSGELRQELSKKVLGKRRALADDEEPPRKRKRESDDEDYDPQDNSRRNTPAFASRSRSPSPFLPDFEIPRQSERGPRTFKCLVKTCTGKRTFATAKDRNRHMDTHFDKRFQCQNPQCRGLFPRDDALKRHCLDSQTGDCARFWIPGVDYAISPPGWRICPLDELNVPDKRDPLYKERWAGKTWPSSLCKLSPCLT